jgi:DNA-binding CsgD family transcriptional regulator
LLPALANTFAADAVCLYEIDTRLNAGEHRLFNLEPGSLSLYRQHFARLDPLHPRNASQRGVDVLRLSDVIAHHDLVRSDYYRQFMLPLGMRDEIEIVLREAGRPVAGVSLIRGAGRRPFDEGDAAWARSALPMLRLLLRDPPRPGVGSVDDLLRQVYSLSDRELEIVGLIGTGLSNKAIGQRLGIAVPTVKSHVHRILAKTGVASRAALISSFLSRPPTTALPVTSPPA